LEEARALDSACKGLLVVIQTRSIQPGFSNDSVLMSLWDALVKLSAVNQCSQLLLNSHALQFLSNQLNLMCQHPTGSFNAASSDLMLARALDTLTNLVKYDEQFVVRFILGVETLITVVNEDLLSAIVEVYSPRRTPLESLTSISIANLLTYLTAADPRVVSKLMVQKSFRTDCENNVSSLCSMVMSYPVKTENITNTTSVDPSAILEAHLQLWNNLSRDPECMVAGLTGGLVLVGLHSLTQTSTAKIPLTLIQAIISLLNLTAHATVTSYCRSVKGASWVRPPHVSEQIHICFQISCICPSLLLIDKVYLN
jgi:hypothetical protein